MRFFCGTAERRKLAFVSDDGAQKTASASAECRFASVSMMARGGREKASQRLNPESHQSPSQIPDRAILFDLLNNYSEQAVIKRLTHSANRGHLASISLIPTSSAIMFPSRTLSYF